MAKISRDLAEMTDRLEVQLNLLESHSREAFANGNAEYYGEVATKLRLLLVRSRANTPLLFQVGEQLQYPLSITLDGPPVERLPGEPRSGETIPLDQFFDLMAVYVQTSTGPAQLTKRELIRAWSEKLGGAHEDWSVGEVLARAVQSPVTFNGIQPSAIELMKCASTTLRSGRELVAAARAAAISLKHYPVS